MNEPRNLAGALLFYPIGLALAGGGAIALGWLALAAYDAQRALDAALWALRHSPVHLDAPADDIAHDLVRPGSRLGQTAFAAFVAWLGWGLMRGARTSLRPWNVSDDGKFTGELKTLDPRVGEKLEGTLTLAKAPAAHEIFRVELRCNRVSTIGGSAKEYRQRMFDACSDVAAIESARGWTLPFSFAIPADAPASGTSGQDFIEWRMHVIRMDALVTTGSWLELQIREQAKSQPSGAGSPWALPPQLLRALDPRTPMNQGKALVYLVLILFVILPIVATIVRAVMAPL